MLVVEASLTLLLLYQYNVSLVAASWRLWYGVLSAIRFVFRFDLLHGRKCTLAHVCASKECIFNAKSFSLGNLSSLLTNF